MALEVIGAGFGRTGTRSLQLALQQLGFSKCYHMAEVGANPDHLPLWEAATRRESFEWDRIFEGYRAGVDWPVSAFWRELAEYYPDAKVVLSTRDEDAWFRSVHNTIYPNSVQGLASEDATVRRRARWVTELIWNGVLKGKIEDREAAIAIFRRHLDEVRHTIPPERLLTFEAADGWEPLCAFLDVPIPDEPYPRTNTTEQWRARQESAN